MLNKVHNAAERGRQERAEDAAAVVVVCLIYVEIVRKTFLLFSFIYQQVL